MFKVRKMSSLLPPMHNTMHFIVVISYCIFVLLDIVNGFTVGVPPLKSVCVTMTPQHHHYLPQSSEAPFTVTVDRKEITGGSEMNVRLTGTDPNTKFIGFYLQARDVNDGAIGSFTPNDLTKVHSCSGMRANAAHHASGEVKKDNVTISWRAPKKYQGEVSFTATLVRDFVTYWVFVMSEPVSISEGTPEQNQIIPPRTRIRTNVNNNIQKFITNLSNPITNFFQTITSRLAAGHSGLNISTGSNGNSNNSRIFINNNISRKNSENDHRSPSGPMLENNACVLTLFKFKLFCLFFQG